MAAVKCNMCKGNKTIYGIGMLSHACSTCAGKGYIIIQDDKNTVHTPSLEGKRMRGRPKASIQNG